METPPTSRARPSLQAILIAAAFIAWVLLLLFGLSFLRRFETTAAGDSAAVQ